MAHDFIDEQDAFYLKKARIDPNDRGNVVAHAAEVVAMLKVCEEILECVAKGWNMQMTAANRLERVRNLLLKVGSR